MISPRRSFTSSLVPAEVLEVLHPLEVGDDHAARVGHHVGHHEDALVAEDLVGRGVVGLLAPSTIIRQRMRSAFSLWIIPPSAAGMKTSHSIVEQLVGVDRLAAVEVGDVAALAHVLGERPRRRCRRRCGWRRWRRTTPTICGAELLHEPRRPGADVAEALHARSGSRTGSRSSSGAASRNIWTTPRPVAASRP